MAASADGGVGQDEKRRAAMSIQARQRGNSARTDGLKRSNSATVIQAHHRRHQHQRQYSRQRKAAIDIQQTHRRRSDLQWSTKPEDVAAIKLVGRMLAMEKKPDQRKQAAELLTANFVDELNMPGARSTSRGIGQYCARASKRQPITAIYTAPKVARSEAGKKGFLIIVETEVCMGGMSDVRMTFDVLLKGPSDDPRISRRIIEPLAPFAALDAAAASQSIIGRPADRLRESFAALDVDASGTLSMDELISASKLVGLKFKRDQLATELQLTDALGGNDTFELHEVDAVGAQN
mmetsp:Transcript_28802/g.73960  ORF Transcript_28802/g.73960 Transcript_28802/m.73960 type:complete len:293 (+) Transcript_28802:22-900(+)